MAKNRAPSKHSRAARRATSPGIDTDQSLKDVRLPPRSSNKERPSVLAAHQSAGVQKKSKRGRKAQMSHKARKRHERGLQMAEAVAERTGKKVERSKGKAGIIQYRRKGWENINKDAEVEEVKADERREGEDEEWETEDEEGKEVEAEADGATAETAPTDKPLADDQYLAVDDDGDEEIL